MHFFRINYMRGIFFEVCTLSRILYTLANRRKTMVRRVLRYLLVTLSIKISLSGPIKTKEVYGTFVFWLN